MQIVLIVLFAALLSPGLLAERAIHKPFTAQPPTLIAAGAFTLLLPLMIGLASWVCRRRLHRPAGFAYATNLFGRIHTAMRVALLAGFALLVTQTGWLHLIRYTWQPFGWRLAHMPLVSDLALIAPVLIATILCWLAMYRTDRELRQAATAGLPEELTGQSIWTLAQYMDFQIRSQVLTVLVPMGLFILGADSVGMYRAKLIGWTTLAWAPEAVLALLAALVFVLSPVILRLVWRTQQLPASPLRSRLEETCRRMHLRYRDILIWKSHGSMVNAAVMGLLPHIRYILLSDGLLEHLSQEQVEAVFGHEAGHVKEHHIAYYMVFAIASMVAVSLAGDWMLQMANVRAETIELAVAGMVAFIWFVAFGWISRRFERQADLHGVRCLDGTLQECSLPCWQHNIAPAEKVGGRICTTAAQVFASALEAVAALNGISKFARSWRHSSIASRQDFVRQAAFYPDTLRRFERTISWIKAGLVGLMLVLGLVAAWFYWPMLFPQPQPPKIEYRQGPSTWVERDYRIPSDKPTTSTPPYPG